MPSIRKILVGAGAAGIAVVAAFSLYLRLALPNCTLLRPSEVVSPDGGITAVIESRACSDPSEDWARVTLRARDQSEVPIVFRLLKAGGPIAVRWTSSSRIEVRYPSGAQTWQSTRLAGWPAVEFVAATDL
jgi:hypothetical protein